MPCIINFRETICHTIAYKEYRTSSAHSMLFYKHRTIRVTINEAWAIIIIFSLSRAYLLHANIRFISW